MKSTTLTLPKLGLIAGTRAMLGAGIALLVTAKTAQRDRILVGSILAAVGILTTIPLGIEVLGSLEDKKHKH